MYVDSTSAAAACNFDPSTNNPMSESAPEVVLHSHNTTTTFAHEENLRRLSMEEELSNYHHNAAMEIEQQFQNEMDFGTMDQNTTTNAHFVNPFDTHQATNWDTSNEMQQQLPPTPDLLSLFHLPSSSSVLPHSSINFPHPKTPGGCFPGSFGYEALPETPSGAAASSVMYDPMFHLNQLPPQPQPPLFRELLQSLPHGYNLGGSRNGSSLFSNGGDEVDDGSRQLFENGVLEFSKEMKPFGRGRGGNKGTKHFATERQRRVQLNDKFHALRELVPNPTKPDRASVVGDAIDYIQELKRTVSELKLLVEKKRCGRERSKRHKTEQDIGAGDDDESCNMKPLGDHDHDHSYNNGSLRSSWLQRKSKDTEVDVRIIDDEVTIKLVQRKKINLLLSVSKLLDELQLELHHAAGGHIGNSYSFLFNTKMYEGSSLYASAIANKLIETLDRQYAAIPPTNSY
ncbi:putative transcription factor bHLH family [Rosa chinensis]|uniref:Putative transcription factor bHLH family n=1 Tax=Rosa chinensis TaxID=74649 RepID=A0A2P6SCU1_ROSCH|nr:transcription factor bHLH91 [Rosa chinensis]XP_040363305.1 transcription factor bHLH91 [Rosa chinensis]PRQ56494.1 putative transcription factor bHLH family [Rosa chinensis]